MDEKEKLNPCGCGDPDCDCDEEMETMVLTMDDETELECGVLGVFDVDGKDYIALMSFEDETVLLYKYAEDGEEVTLDSIDNDEEFEKVSNEFYELYGEEDEE
ncbi:MAG: DUF1292 domain-containing protein [Lachnospiraceae bacterium]|nr:DUF1292 domain-containing protein [Lachnospiraceae bacterium]